MKGIRGSVKLGTEELKNWNQTAVPLTDISWTNSSFATTQEILNVRQDYEGYPGSMMFYKGLLHIAATPADTFLKLDGWTKVRYEMNVGFSSYEWKYCKTIQALIMYSKILVTS